MLRFGILDKRVYPQIPPRVEYVFTPFGERFLEILDGIERLKNDAAAGRIAAARPAARHATDNQPVSAFRPRVGDAPGRTRPPPASPPRPGRER
ncbi:MAG: winged helix-turn-helix transcriptional regulator [Phycisphaeraceae bacterium]|nr:winged helix-turn-helix transcriptional regulator [Phycisphaeraceae bacterium]